MTDVPLPAMDALHTAARHYCRDRQALWIARYVQRSSAVDHPEAQDIYPRYQVLAAILVDVESVTPDRFDTMADLRRFLVMAGQTATDAVTRPPHSVIAERAMQAERDLFCAYVQNLTVQDLGIVEPLPYQRSLSQAEHAALWTRLHERWGVREGQYWYPLLSEADVLPPHVLAFQQAWFDRAVPPTALQQILRHQGIRRVWELREFGPEYEMDLAELEPHYNGAEGYWTSGEMEWLVYASHESSITVAGAWLVAAVQTAWPEWAQHLYTGWDDEPPPLA